MLVDTGAAASVAPKSFASRIELSSASSTLQLTTATGKAVRTYGLKRVDLQSQGLSLEVTSVIADVVTPLLGLDSMIKGSLELKCRTRSSAFPCHSSRTTKPSLNIWAGIFT